MLDNFSCRTFFSPEILLISLVCILLCHFVTKNPPKVTIPDNIHPNILLILEIFNSFSINGTISSAGTLIANIKKNKAIPMPISWPLFNEAINTFCKNPQKLGLFGLCLLLFLFLLDKLMKWLVGCYKCRGSTTNIYYWSYYTNLVWENINYGFLVQGVINFKPVPFNCVKLFRMFETATIQTRVVRTTSRTTGPW